jgi:hypothetical protein
MPFIPTNKPTYETWNPTKKRWEDISYSHIRQLRRGSAFFKRLATGETVEIPWADGTRRCRKKRESCP